MFTLTYIGHAGWVCTNKGFKCAFDPWISEAGAFLDQWYPFPDNSNVDIQEVFSDLDFLYISHAHEDHLSENTLKYADRETRVLIPDFKDKTLANKLKSLGFKNIDVVPAGELITIKGIDIKLIKDEAFIYNDSAILLSDGSQKVLNLNDCHADFSTLKQNVGDVDLLLLQASSANYWPCAYEYEEGVKRKLGKKKRENTSFRAQKYAEILNARMTIPNAGPPVIRGETFKEWNFNRREEWNPFCLADDSCRFLASQGINSQFLLPLDKVQVAEEITFDLNEEFRREVYEDVDGYTEKYLRKIESNPHPSSTVSEQEMSEAVSKFLKQVAVLSKVSKFYIKKIDFPILFDFKHLGKWIVDFSTPAVVHEYTDQEHCYYFEMDPASVALTFRESSVDFEHYLLGCDFKCSRDPDTYNEFLFTTLKNFDSRRFKMSESLYADMNNVLDELFIMNHDGKEYEVQKYCPHMFADMEEAGYVDEDNNLVCPLHNWKFNLETGECVDKKDYCIKVQKRSKDDE